MKNNTVMRPFLRTLLLVSALLYTSTVLMAQVSVNISIAPPPLPVYTQPFAPGPGFIWTPGYWAYGINGYFWVPGTWVRAPFVGALWTPGYWGWRNGFYAWNAGYWGPRVGFYGGVNYGYGYVGSGYHGGYWNNGAFHYNTAVNNINVNNIHNTYNKTVIENTSVSRVSYHGGNGGVAVQPNAQERQAERDRHTNATQVQTRHEQSAGSNRSQWASVNQGAPGVAATPKAGAFNERNQATAKGAPAGTVIPAGPNRQANAARAPGTQAGAEGQPLHGNPHRNGGTPAAQGAPHAQAQTQGTHHGGEHREDGQRGRQ